VVAVRRHRHALARAVVEHLDPGARVAHLDAHGRRAGGAVAQDVRERLLHRAEQRRADVRRHRAAPAGELDRDVDARHAHAVRELLERLDALGRARRRGRLVLRAQDAERRAQVGERLAGHPLDLLQRAARALGLTVDEVGRHAGLHVDRDHRVGDDVVELARDAQALLPHAAQRLLLAGALRAVGALLDRGDEGPVVALRAPDRERQEGQPEVLQGLEGEDAVGAEERHEHDGRRRDTEGEDDRRPAVGPQRGCVERQDRRQRDRHRGLERRHRREGAGDDHAEHRERPARADGERQAGRQRDGDMPGAQRRPLVVQGGADDDEAGHVRGDDAVPPEELVPAERALPPRHAHATTVPSDRRPVILPAMRRGVLPGEYLYARCAYHPPPCSSWNTTTLRPHVVTISQ
jgi:hypothetical protein